MEKEKASTTRPPAPEELEGEALLEWHRISGELEQLGRLTTADRAVMLLYCQTWAAHHAAAKHVNTHGPVIRWPNGVPGPSPFFKVMKETASLLRGFLADMGLTPEARGLDAAKQPDAGELEF